MKHLDKLWTIRNREFIDSKIISRAIGVTIFVILTALGAFVYIPLPFTPVPITLQTLFVLLAGPVLGGAWGAVSQLGYVVLGSLGLPIFTGARGGLICLFGPTGGYLFGFVVAALVVGRLIRAKAGASWSWLVFSMAVGSLIIYLLGTIQLIVLFHWGLKRALLLGVMPFVPGDTVKLIAASFIYRRLEPRVSKIFPS